MDSDKDLIKRAVGNRAEISMSSTAQKRTIDWVDPHSAASTPRKLQSPRGGRSDLEKDTGIVQQEEAKRVETEQARDQNANKLALDDGSRVPDQGDTPTTTTTTTTTTTRQDKKSVEEGTKKDTAKDTPKDVEQKANSDDKADKNDSINEVNADDKIENKTSHKTHNTDNTDKPDVKTDDTKSDRSDSKPTNGHSNHGSTLSSSRTHSRSNSITSRPSSAKAESRGSSTPARSLSETPSSQPPPTYNTWKYSAKTITKASPSAKDGMPFREELMMRTKGINFLGNVAKLLQLPHMAVYTACTFFHRFYMRHSIKSKHPFEAAAVCIFLATKVEEANRHLRDVCICLVKVAQKDHRAVVDEQSKDFWRWRDCILYGEGYFLEILCFDLTLDSPFEHLSYYVKKLDIHHVKEVCKTAWEFVTDSCKTPLCLMFSTNTIALAAIYWAAKHHKIPIDYHKETKARGKQHWVECFDMTRNEVVYVVETFCDWYSILQRDFGLAASYPKLK
jgi:protein BUR2